MSKIDIGDNLKDTLEIITIIGGIVLIALITKPDQTSEDKKQEVKHDSTIVNEK